MDSELGAMTSEGPHGWMARLRMRLRAGRWERQARALYARGEFALSAEAYQESLRLRPGRAVALMNLGLALYKDDRRREGREVWTQALAAAEGRNPYVEEQVRILLRQFG